MGKSNCFLVFCLFLFLSNECQALSCYNGGVATVFGTTPVYNNITKAECYPEQNFCLTGAFSATFSGFIEGRNDQSWYDSFEIILQIQRIPKIMSNFYFSF